MAGTGTAAGWGTAVSAGPGPAVSTGTAGNSERSFLFVVGSSRAGGNTEALARLAAERLPADIPRRWLCLREPGAAAVP